MTLIDGRAQFGCELAALPDHPLSAQGMTMRKLMGSRKLDIPPLSAVADAEPLPAWVQQGMLVAACPECAGKPEQEHGLVWRSGPHLFLCLVCGNAGVGHRWRPVELPDALAEIETALSVRPQSARTWKVGETVDDLAAENRRFGWEVRA